MTIISIFILIRTESLQGDNAFTGEKCQRKTNAQSSFTIEQAPDVLTIQLKRFRYENNTMKKVNHFVTYPLVLDIVNHLSGVSPSVSQSQAISNSHSLSLFSTSIECFP